MPVESSAIVITNHEVLLLFDCLVGYVYTPCFVHRELMISKVYFIKYIPLPSALHLSDTDTLFCIGTIFYTHFFFICPRSIETTKTVCTYLKKSLGTGTGCNGDFARGEKCGNTSENSS